MVFYSGKLKEPALSQMWLGIEEHTFNSAEARESQIQPRLHRLFQKIIIKITEKWHANRELFPVFQMESKALQ